MTLVFFPVNSSIEACYRPLCSLFVQCRSVLSGLYEYLKSSGSYFFPQTCWKCSLASSHTLSPLHRKKAVCVHYQRANKPKGSSNPVERACYLSIIFIFLNLDWTEGGADVFIHLWHFTVLVQWKIQQH